MSTIFLLSDTHFSHRNLLSFVREDGTRLRLHESAEAMDEALVAGWNSRVRPQDKVYHLGDVTMRKEFLPILNRCNGHKRLVRGNHDIFPTKLYLPYFEDIYGVRVFEGLILSHIPLHPESLKRGWINVHGHTHAAQSRGPLGPGYFNVSVESLENYAPLSLEELRIKIA